MPRLLAVVVVGLVAAACGSGAATGSSGSSPRPTAQAVHVALPAGPLPSQSAKMVCSSETQQELASTLGVRPSAPVEPTWVDHLYSCTLAYGNGQMTLSVKELSDADQTTAYFDGLGAQLGNASPINGLGQGAFTTNNGSVVARKDYKVLFVDISGLPAQFGVPATSRADVAITVADVIMGCWSGD